MARLIFKEEGLTKSHKTTGPLLAAEKPIIEVIQIRTQGHINDQSVAV